MHLLIGLDINQYEVRLLQLAKAKRRIFVKNFALSALPDGAILQGKITQISAVQAALHTVVAKTATAGLATAMALPQNLAISKQLKFPKTWPASAIATEIVDNLPQYLPDITEEVFFDFSLLPSQQTDYQTVLLVAALKSDVQSYIDAATHAGLFPKVIDIDEHVAARVAITTLEPISHGEFATVAPRFLVAYGLACRGKKTW